MFKDFHSRAILTTQDPGAFLNFRFDTSDDVSISIFQTNIPERVMYINGIDANLYPSEGYKLLINSDVSVASFHVFTRSFDDFDYNIRIDVSGTTNQSYDVSICNRPFKIYSNNINTFETSNIQIDGETSYMLLRTNPKFTGNIKLSIDTSNNLYLDTFKVSDILNNKKYRKQQVSAESIFSGDIRRTFSTLPYGEMYKLDEEDTLNISLPKTDLFKQFNVNYSYGARLFEDELYDDDYSLLAPLWLNSKLPDYFAVFRIDGVYNQETYDTGNDLSGLAKKYIEEGELIKSWSMKESTPLGTYLRNHMEELLSVRSPLFLSLSDPTQKDPDPNTWYGIAVDKGLITGRSETPYFFDQKTTFTDTNAFLSQGFERLNLLCPNLINLEYIFSDEDVSLYTMHRYFGLYLSENKLYKIAYYCQEPDSSIQILSLDSKEPSTFFYHVFDTSGNIKETYKNRIFTLNDTEKSKRISEISQVDGTNKTNIEEWINRAGEQLFSTKTEEQISNKFLTLSLTNPLHQGEHLRFIDNTTYTIWEAYSIKPEMVDAGEIWPFLSVYRDPSNEYPTIYRAGFSVNGTINDQIKAIKKAFDLFNTNYDIVSPFETTVLRQGSNTLSFELKNDFNTNDISFQRLTAQTVFDPNDPSSQFNNAADYSDIKFYGVLEPTLSDFERISFDSSYGPINFELYGDRMSLTLNLIDISSNHLYSIDPSVTYKIEDYTLYMSTDGWYRKINQFVVSTTTDHVYNYVLSPHESNDNIVLNTSNDIYEIEGMMNAYSTYPISISLMGINPVKDMDFTVYDSSIGFESEYWYSRIDDVSTYYFIISPDSSVIIDSRNSYEITQGTGYIYINDVSTIYSATTVTPFHFNTYDGSAYVLAAGSLNTLITYNQLDGSASFSSYNTGVSEESINSYYIDSTKSKLKYGLTVPYVAKWVALGTDCRNNQLRLLLDTSVYDASSNFIPYGNEYNKEISYPVFKYLDPGTRAWEDYIFYDINDVVQYNIDTSVLNISFKQLMFVEPYLDVFSKLLYSNHNIPNVILRSSIVFYNNYKNSIDCIIKGLNLSFFLDESSKNTFNIRDWDRFRISFVSTSSRNYDNNHPIEIFINENIETILIVWYQGVDTLNYNKRYSSYFGGRSVMYEDSSVYEFQSHKNNDMYWSHIKTPFVINSASSSTDFTNIYDVSSGYDEDKCSPYAQLNWNYGNLIYSMFNAYGKNVASGYSFQFFNTQYNAFRQYIDYVYTKDSGTYGDGVFNYAYTYMNNQNIYKDVVCDLNMLKNIISTNNIQYYIFKGNLLYSNSSFSVNPVLITLNNPKNYKGIYTYNGWYTPKFNNIIDFNHNESSELMNVVEKDFTLCNTNFIDYNNIPQMWYNKVVEQVTTNDVSVKNAIGYKTDFNVFKSQWDSGYYTLDSSSYNMSIDGFNSTLEVPSFFGSKLIKLPSSLVLNSWDNTNASYVTGRLEYTMEFNITRKITSMFKSNETFTNNWSDLTTSDNTIDGYIKKTVLNYYNLSKSKVNIEIWSKPFDGTVLSYVVDDTFVLDNAANVDARLVTVNSEFIYRIKTAISFKKTYFIKFTLFEK